MIAASVRWTTVFSGSMAEAIVLRGLLESNEVEARILDEHIKVIDPFITGAGALDVQLQVPEPRVLEAREILDLRPPSEEKVEPRDPAEERVHQLGVRIRWSAILIVTMPYALWLARPYLLAVRALGRRPNDHGWTVAAILWSAVLLVALLARFAAT